MRNLGAKGRTAKGNMVVMMDGSVDLDLDYWFADGMRRYLAAVAAELGVGLESCAIDTLVPAAGYVALDPRLARFPDRDFALLWDERHGWSAAVEDTNGDDLIVLSYLGGELLPTPAELARFVTAVHAEDHTVGELEAPQLGEPGADREALTERMRALAEGVVEIEDADEAAA
jgi:hypothetical protein